MTGSRPPHPAHARGGPRDATAALHPLLAGRWSPTTFDGSAEIGQAEVQVLLEAARWAPSAGNSQPWAFVVGRRGDEVHRRLVGHLARSAATWAPTAGLLVANLAHRHVEGTDWEYSEFALYDLGQAVAHLTLQASALDLHVRQFRAFDRAGVAADFGVPTHWEVTSMAAVGRVAPGVRPQDPTGGEPPSRQRRAVEEIVWART